MRNYPTHPDDMSAIWLAQTLGQSPTTLRGFSVKPVGTGQMCDSYRLTLDWVEPADHRPATIIAKCPSTDPASRDVAQRLGSYKIEVNWYQSLAREVVVPMAQCHFARIDDNDVDFLLLLSDLAPARQGDQLAGVDAATLYVAIDAAAALHAPLWNSPRLDSIGWLKRDTRPIVRALFPGMFEQFRARYADRLNPECLALGAAIVDKLDAFLERIPHARTLTHGDLRVDNILFAPDRKRCWVVDWQTLGTGSGATDIAYLIGTSVANPDARTPLDTSGFARWIVAIQSHGVDTDEAALWDDYRLGALSGYFMAVFASMSVERTKRGDEMFAVMAERPARQALALDSLSLI